MNLVFLSFDFWQLRDLVSILLSGSHFIWALLFSLVLLYLLSPSLEKRNDTQSGAGNRGDEESSSSISRIREILCERMLFVLSGASGPLCFQKPFALI